MTVKIDETKCTGCGICVQACPTGAITVDRVAKIDAETCVDCGSCVAECPNGAIFVERKEASLSYRKYVFHPSHGSIKQGGRLTVSPRTLGQQLGFSQVNRGEGFPKHVFDFFGKSGGHGYGRGKGQNGRRGRRNRSRS